MGAVKKRPCRFGVSLCPCLFIFLDALASLDFKLSVSESFTFFTASASTGLSELFYLVSLCLFAFVSPCLHVFVFWSLSLYNTDNYPDSTCFTCALHNDMLYFLSVFVSVCFLIVVFLSDPSPIIGYACHSLTHSLTD